MSKYIPDLYDKQSKVQFFYNEFKRRDANPEGFDNKMKNWYASINKYCEEEDQFLIDLAELRTQFEHLSCKPHTNCLKLVLTNMIKDHKLLAVEEFKKEFLDSQNSGWFNWGFNSVKKTIGWFSSNVTTNYVEQIDDQLNESIQFVNLNVFDRIARKVFNYIKENGLTGQILKYNELEEDLCSELDLDKEQLELIILFLESKSNCKRIDSNTRIIKFEDGDATITDKELSLMKLDDAKSMIEQDIEKLEEEIEKCKEEAREAVKQNNKSKGMNILKKKARFTQQLERKHNQYDNIEILEDQLLNSDANKQILEVLAKSSQVLKAKSPEPDNVDDLLCTIEEAMESQKSFLHDISRPLGGQQFDDDDLEEELKQLIEEDEIEKIAGTSKSSNDLAENKFKDISRTATKVNTQEDVSDELFERLRKLKGPPTTTPNFSSANKKEKPKYALLDDDEF